MDKQKVNKEAVSKPELYTVLGTRAKVRMWQIDSVLTGIRYRIEVKKWYGWVQPSISYSEDGQFYNKLEAEKWFKYLSGEKDKKKLIAWAQHCAYRTRINFEAMNKDELRKILRGKCISDEACESALDELLNLFSVITSNHNKTWAKMRHDACINRENVAIEWMMERYVDEEYNDERVKEVINHYRKTHSL